MNVLHVGLYTSEYHLHLWRICFRLGRGIHMSETIELQQMGDSLQNISHVRAELMIWRPPSTSPRIWGDIYGRCLFIGMVPVASSGTWRVAYRTPPPTKTYNSEKNRHFRRVSLYFFRNCTFLLVGVYGRSPSRCLNLTRAPFRWTSTFRICPPRFVARLTFRAIWAVFLFSLLPCKSIFEIIWFLGMVFRYIS